MGYDRAMRILSLALLGLLAACGGGGDDAGGGDGGGGGGDGGGGGGGGQPSAEELFGAATATVRLEVDYQDGAAPYTGSAGLFGDTWALSEANLGRLFQGKTLELPHTIGEMQLLLEVDDGGDGGFSIEEILAIADAHRDDPSAGDTATFYGIWVDGMYQDGSGVRDGVLGVSIGDTGVIAMFKPVIASTGTIAFPNLERFVEQTVLIHELGHGAGLTNNGIPMLAPHQDEAHGAHCSNDQCVMYWLNEGASDAAEFARMYVVSGDSIVFAEDCLADADALRGE